MALRRARHGERTARLEELALVIEPLHLARVGVAAGLLVDDDGAVVPRVPMPEHDLHELVGPVVAQVVLQVLLAPHVERFAIVDRGHHVPGRAPVRHQIERGEAAGDVEGLEVGGRAGGGEAQLRGHRAHGHQHDQRVHLRGADAVFDGVGVVVAVAVGHGQAVVEERHVELAGFEDAGDFLVVVGRMGVVARFRMAPGARQVRAVLRLQEAHHHHLPRHVLSPRPCARTPHALIWRIAARV